MEPLKTQAARLSSEPSPGPSAALSPNIATLVERFAEPVPGETWLASAAEEPALAPPTAPLVRPQAREGEPARLPASLPAPVPVSPKKSRPGAKGLTAALVGIPFVLAAGAFVLLWQGTMPRGGNGVTPAEVTAAVSPPASAGLAMPGAAAGGLEVALSSSDRIEAEAGARIAFPVVIDATAALPAGSIVTVAALPAGASLSSGQPYGDGEWSLRPDEVGDLSLQLPAQSGVADIRLALVGGDGTVLAQSETRLSVTPPPVAAAPLTGEPVASEPVTALTTGSSDEVASVETQPAETEPVETVETTGSIANVPPPVRKPTASADSAVKVNKVKAITIPAPRASRPHDGAYALAPAQDDPQGSGGEWMVTKTAVDMHAKAEQRSETVKVAEKGLKMRVTARDKNWIQVHDPKSATTGWIYNRFLKPSDPPAQ